jgi:hypothetical protein
LYYFIQLKIFVPKKEKARNRYPTSAPPHYASLSISLLHIGTVSSPPNLGCSNLDDPVLEKVTDQGVAVF